MDKKESRKFFEDWLRAYADHLHLVRQGHSPDLVRPAAVKPAVSVKTGTEVISPARKSTTL